MLCLISHIFAIYYINILCLFFVSDRKGWKKKQKQQKNRDGHTKENKTKEKQLNVHIHIHIKNKKGKENEKYCVAYDENLPWVQQNSHNCHGPDIQDFPNGLSETPAIWDYLSQKIPLKLLAGFIGFKQKDDLTIHSNIGLCVCVCVWFFVVCVVFCGFLLYGIYAFFLSVFFGVFLGVAFYLR